MIIATGASHLCSAADMAHKATQTVDIIDVSSETEMRQCPEGALMCAI